MRQGCHRKRKYKFCRKLKPGPKYRNPTWSRTPILRRCPQAKGIVTKLTTMSPKKPNSAIRHVAKVKLNKSVRITWKKLKLNKILRVTARLPGRGYLVSKYSRVLVEGGRANDLPGVGYTAIRGVFDFAPLVTKKQRRSVYGMGRLPGYTKHVRRCFRHL